MNRASVSFGVVLLCAAAILGAASAAAVQSGGQQTAPARSQQAAQGQRARPQVPVDEERARRLYVSNRPEDHAPLTAESLAYDRELERRGHFLGANALQEPRSAVTIQVRDGRMTTTDGPFAETKEHLGGYILIEARDLNEAIRIASQIPMARYGSIEVRPVMELRAE